MKNKVKKVILLVIIIIIVNLQLVVFADVGSFESYDSGSSGGSSDSTWGSRDSSSRSSDSSSGSSHSYSTRSSSSSYRDRSNNNNTEGSTALGNILEAIVIISIVISIVKVIKTDPGKIQYRPVNRTVKAPPIHKEYYQSEGDTLIIEKRIKTIDESFSAEEFITWTKDFFVKLQEAWMNKDWDSVRLFETKELFEQHKSQLKGYIDSHQTNMLENIIVEGVYLTDFRKSNGRDVLTVTLNSKMIDYIIDDNTKKIIKGNKYTQRKSTYKLTFIRKLSEGMNLKIGNTNIIKCPNCNADAHITATGKCEYCGSILIATEEFNWVLSNLEKIG